jgi:acyl carrier protein
VGTNDVDVLREFIHREIGYEGTLDADMDLLQAQVLDSFNVVQLAMFVQERFGIELETEDLVRTNVSTLSSLAALVQRKRAGAS